MAHDVFISYPHQDKAVADAACARLETEAVRCWIAPRDILPGQEWAASIARAVEQSRVMVLVFSSHANQSKQVRREVQLAFEKEKPVIPFRIEAITPVSSLAYYMGSIHWLDALTPPVEQHLHALASSLQALLGLEAPRDTRGDNKKTKAQKSGDRLAQLEQVIECFLIPIKTRLQKDGAIWERILKIRHPADSLEHKVAAGVERDVLENHGEIESIISKYRYLVDSDQELSDALNKYLDHVAVYRRIRSSGDTKAFPISLDAPWPEELFPLIENRLRAVTAERQELNDSN
jgi:hypothetical protein